MPMLELEALARAAAAHAHAPYSQFRVGCALRTAQGALYSGCNVENAAYPLSGCAERHALAAAVRAEGLALEVTELLVLALDGSDGLQDAAPCGGCRQQILEFGSEIEVHFRSAGRWHSAAIRTLLPFGFCFERR